MVNSLFAELVPGLPGQYVPYAVGGAVAAAVLTAVFLANRRRTPGFDPSQLVAGTGPVTEDKALHWAPPEQSYSDRRGASRREGSPVRVLLSSPTFRNGTNDGYVVDRSTGGLRIALQSAMAPGSTLQVRASNAPSTVAFVTVIVRNCKKNGDFFELGCEFEKTPPWNVLLLFG